MESRYSVRETTYMGIFIALMAICSWITIPAPVPFTLQVFGVFLALTLLGGRRGTTVIALYIVMGAIGLPMFAGMTGGLGFLSSTTGGYIVGFLGSGLVYWLMTDALGDKLWVQILAMGLGLVACYLIGTVWFMAIYARTSGAISWLTALSWCVFPFIIPDCCKIALALTVGKTVKAQMKI